MTGLDSMGHALLVAVDGLTRATYSDTDGASVVAELEATGHTSEDETLRNLFSRLRDDGYLVLGGEGFGGPSAIGFVRVTAVGREAARTPQTTAGHADHPSDRRGTPVPSATRGVKPPEPPPSRRERWAAAFGPTWAAGVGSALVVAALVALAAVVISDISHDSAQAPWVDGEKRLSDLANLLTRIDEHERESALALAA